MRSVKYRSCRSYRFRSRGVSSLVWGRSLNHACALQVSQGFGDAGGRDATLLTCRDQLFFCRELGTQSVEHQPVPRCRLLDDEIPAQARLQQVEGPVGRGEHLD
jgi:hypothetical protein